MSFRIVDFDNKYIRDAGQLLQENQNKALNIFDSRTHLSHERCCQIITEELKKDISSSIMFFDDEKFAGYAIPVIIDDPIWGKKGWVNMGGWAIESEYTDQIILIYQKISEKWIQSGVYQHYFLVYASNTRQLSLFNELGFAKEQAHGIFDLSEFKLKEYKNNRFQTRKADRSDQHQISGLSRIIAEHQTKSPCYASAPQSYLQALDKGFSELTADEEADLYVIEENQKIIGLNIFYKEESVTVIIPKNSVELAVSAIKDDYRGKGAGYELFAFSLQKQIESGFDFSVTDWRCANLLSSRFWQKRGYEPVAYRLLRRIDPLIK